MPAIKQLFDLQAVDLELGRRSNRLTEIVERLGNDAELVPMREEAASLDQAVQETSSGQADLEAAIAAFEVKITEAESKLYGGRVTLARELMDLQADVNMIKRQLREQEDKLLVVLVALEQAQTRLDDASQLLDAAETEWTADQASMAAERGVLLTEVTELQAKRDAQAKAVSGAELALYEQVRKGHAGRAVARMRNGTCESCRVALPTRQASSVRISATPVRCPSCGLILLAD